MPKIPLKRHIKELKKRKPPLLVVNAVIQTNERILLIKRGKRPAKGMWVVPGGHVKHNEDLEEAVIREAKEETGLDVKIVGIISVKADKEGSDPRGYHLAVTFLVTPQAGRVRKTKEATDIKWFQLGKLPQNIGLGCEKYFQETVTKGQQVKELVRHVPPMPMVNQIIYRNKTKILLGKRNKPPYFSEWVLPGGHLHFDESIEEASLRKAKEETGLSVEIERVIDVASDFGVDPRSRNLVITHLCKYKSGKFKTSKDISEIFWYDVSKPLPQNIRLLAGPFTKAIEKAKVYLLEKQEKLK